MADINKGQDAILITGATGQQGGATALSEVTGREINHFQVPIEQVREFSEDFAIMFEWFDAVGYSADIPANEDRYGIPATGFRDWASGIVW